MPAFLLVLLVGLSVNTLNDHPKNFNDVKASLEKKIEHPVKSLGGPYND